MSLATLHPWAMSAAKVKVVQSVLCGFACRGLKPETASPEVGRAWKCLAVLILYRRLFSSAHPLGVVAPAGLPVLLDAGGATGLAGSGGLGAWPPVWP